MPYRSFAGLGYREFEYTNELVHRWKLRENYIDILLLLGLSHYYKSLDLLGDKLRHSLFFYGCSYGFVLLSSSILEIPNCSSSLFFCIISFLSLLSSPLAPVVWLMKISDLDFAVIVLNFLYLIRFISLYSWESTIFYILELSMLSLLFCSAMIFLSASGLCSSAPYASRISISLRFSLRCIYVLVSNLRTGLEVSTSSGLFFLLMGLFNILMTVGRLIKAVTRFLKKDSRMSTREFIFSTPL